MLNRARGLAKRLLKGPEGFPIVLEYPTSADNHPRYGHGRPTHPQLQALLDQHRPRFRAELESLWSFREDLERIPIRWQEGEVPFWDNTWLTGLDGVSLYGYVRSRKPRHYVEVGSGFSTRFVARAIRDGALSTRIRSIDPQPREGVDSLCDEVIRKPLELAGTEWLDDLEPGDVVFFDGSHRAFMNSDATVFFTELLPRIPSGVLVGIHDIWWPEDYPAVWEERYYSEQYLLAAYLLAGCDWLKCRLASRYVDMEDDLKAVAGDFWTRPGMEGIWQLGLTFWLDVEHGETA